VWEGDWLGIGKLFTDAVSSGCFVRKEAPQKQVWGAEEWLLCPEILGNPYKVLAWGEFYERGRGC
jgi:hypothetical protein